MRKLAQTLAVTLLIIGRPALAGAIPCDDPDIPWLQHTAGTLRAIAGRCDSPELATLMYNRAYYRDLVEENRVFSRLIVYSSREGGQRHMASYTLYIALLEELAPAYYPETGERAHFLNREYERHSEIAELWMRGHGTIAQSLSDKLDN